MRKMAREKVLVGIDIGSTKIATVIALAEADGEIRIIGSASVPSTGIRKAQVVDIEAALRSVTQSVEAAERMAGYSIGSVYLSVGGAHIGCQNSHGVVAVADPGGEITREDVRRVTEAAQAISLPSSREIIHVLPRHFVVDSQEDIRDPVGMTGIRLEVETHIVHGAATTMRNQARVVQELGIDVEGMVYSGLAAAEATLTETEKELGVVLVDLGGGTTSICVYVESALAHSAVLPVGARNVSNDLAIGLRVSLEDAEKIKLHLGREGKTPALPEGTETKKKEKRRDEIDLQALGLSGEAKKVSRRTLIEGIIKPRLVEIFSYVQLELKRAEVLGLTPAGVVLTGGGALTVGAAEVGKVSLSLPVRVGYPAGISGLVDEVSSPAFAATVGLVLYGAKQQEESLEGWGGIMPRFSFGQTALQDVVGRVIDVIKSFIP
jgi:cell division protein FtsA